MKFFWFAAALPFALTACEAPSGILAPLEQAESGITTINSDPQRANLTFSDGTHCLTPCNARIIEDVPLRISKAGYQSIETIVTFPAPANMNFTLSPVGRSTGVEEEKLPDL
ncbi:MAG: PEGA domain-containing protein [bacterium]